MTDIFLSYANEDRCLAERLAIAFEEKGLSVWWDRKIMPGQPFPKEIEHAVKAARAVVVLWSKHSVDSEWVQNEATVGLNRKVLVPVRIDSVDLPIGFLLRQAVDLVDCISDRSHKGSEDLFRKGYEDLCRNLRTIFENEPPKSHLLVSSTGPFLSKLRALLLERAKELYIQNPDDNNDPGDSTEDYITYLKDFRDSNANWLLTNLAPGLFEQIEAMGNAPGGFRTDEYLKQLYSRGKKIIFFDSGSQLCNVWKTDCKRELKDAPFYVLRPNYVLAAKNLLLKLEDVVKKASGPVIFCFLFVNRFPSMDTRRKVYQTFLAGVVYNHQLKKQRDLPLELKNYKYCDEEIEEHDTNENIGELNANLEKLASLLVEREVQILQWSLERLEGEYLDTARAPIKKYLESLMSSLMSSSVIFFCGNDQIAGALDKELRVLGEKILQEEKENPKEGKTVPKHVEEVLKNFHVALLGFDHTDPIQTVASYWENVWTADSNFSLMRNKAERLINGEKITPPHVPIEAPVLRPSNNFTRMAAPSGQRSMKQD